MGRRLRSHMPGVAYHITSRAQSHAPLLLGIEEDVVRIIQESVSRSDAALLAYAVMSNHLHVLVQQGRHPLSRYLQPLLCRVALLVRRTKKHEGHVFERPFFDSPCLDAPYFRNVVAYVHLNPIRAGIADDPGEYEWTSHQLYCAPSNRAASSVVQSGVGLRVFARRAGDDVSHTRENYQAFMRWRAFADTCGDHERPPPPDCDGGDVHWAETHVASSNFALERPDATRRQDLRDIALTLIAERGFQISLEELRSPTRIRRVVRVRREFITRAIRVGYGTGQVARFLQLSDSAVSRVRHPVATPAGCGKRMAESATSQK